MGTPLRPDYRSKRPAPRKAAGAPQPLHDKVVWTREITPRERYRIEYIDRDNEVSLREIELLRMGDFSGERYIGVMHAGRFKTLRADRIRMVAQISTGHEASLHAQPMYSSELPAFPLPGAIYKMPTIAGNRTWTVDLNAYTCACPEKRIRAAMGYVPGRLGWICPHMARAILDYLPAGSPGWTDELLRFLADPRKIHIDNLE